MSLETIVDKPESIPEILARRFEDRARAALQERGRFAVALPGGSVASSCFPRLAACPLDWSRVEFFWGDERGVPTSDPDSNFSLARSLWLEKIPADSQRVHRMRGEREDLTAAAAEYEVEMLRVLGDPPRLDLAILGLGPDGHVCSLFPEKSLLHERSRWVAAVHDSPKAPRHRVTLTVPTLIAAREIAIVALGEAKAAVVGAAVQDEASELPVALIARRPGPTLLLLDPGAASLLGDLGR